MKVNATNGKRILEPQVANSTEADMCGQVYSDICKICVKQLPQIPSNKRLLTLTLLPVCFLVVRVIAFNKGSPCKGLLEAQVV